VGFLEECCAARLACRQLYGSRHRHMVHAFEENEPSAVVDDRQDAAPVVVLRLGLGGGDHLPCRFQAQRFLVQKLRLSVRSRQDSHRGGNANGEDAFHREAGSSCTSV
jgi:hypothetical protein